MASNDKWLLGIVTGTTDTGRSYDVVAGDGTRLRRNRTHLKPRSFDIPVIRANMNARISTPSQSEMQNISLSGLVHPPKVKYTGYNNTITENIVDSSLTRPAHPPKVKYTEKTVPKLVIKKVGDTAYDSYIAETLVPLRSSIKTKKQTRFSGEPVTSVRTIPARRERPHNRRMQDACDPELLIPIELSQPRTDITPDLRGNLSAVSPRERHQSEETLPNVPLGQFQAQRSDSSSVISIAHSETNTPSQSTITFETHNNRSYKISTPSQSELFSETGTGSSSEEGASNMDSDDPQEQATSTRSHSDQQESHSDGSTSHTSTPSQSEITQYTKNIVDSNSYSTSTSSQSEIYSSNQEYEASSESSSRETSRPSSPESGSQQERTLYSPTPEMAIVTRNLHDAIHAVREQQGRPVTRHLLKQQTQVASQKLLVNLQIKTSTPDPPKCNANAPPRRPRARSEKANGVTGSSSEDSSQSDNEPRTASQARFMALKRRFETPPKMGEDVPSHGATSKRQRLSYRTPSQSATDRLRRTLPRSNSELSSEGD